MKKMIGSLLVLGLAFAFSAHAGTVYEDNFDNDGLATNTVTGGGLAVAGTANGATWGDSGNLDFSPDNGDTNERANIASINSFYLSGGFELTVTYSVSDITSDTGGNRFSFGLVSEPPTANTDAFVLGSATAVAFGLNVTAEDSLQGLTLKTGGVAALVAGQSGFTSSTTEVNTVTLSVDAAGDYELVLNGSSVGSGASGLDLSDVFYFAAFSQDNLANPSISSVSLSRLSEENIPPFATDQDITAFPDTSVEITLAGIDYDGSNLTYSVDDSMLAGSLAGATNVWIYTPTNSSFQGVDNFTFTVNDGETNSAPATVTITVTNQLPTADAQSVSTFSDTELGITLTGSDPDNGPSNLTYMASTPSNGTLTGTAPDLTYTPTNGYLGADSFIFTVNDGFEDSDPATVLILVREPTSGSDITFNPTGADSDVVAADMNAVTTGGTWVFSQTPNLGATKSAFEAYSDSPSDSALIWDRTNVDGVIVDLTLNSAQSFDSAPLHISWDMGNTSEAKGSQMLVVGYGADDSMIFAFAWNQRNATLTAYTNDTGGVTMSTAFDHYVDNGVAPATTNLVAMGITLDGTSLTYSADGLTDMTTTVLNSQTALSKISFEAAVGNGVGFALDNLSVMMEQPVEIDVSIGVISGNVVLSWEGGGSYNVETNANLVLPNWGVLESGATSPTTNAIGSEAQLFYKLSE